MTIRTALTKLHSIRVPVVLPPMAGAAGGALASSVAKGGGLGFIAGGAAPLPSLLSEIKKAREALALAPTDPLPLGIGLMLWRLEAEHGDASLAAPFLQATLDAKPAAIWLSFGKTINEWVKNIRKEERERKLERTKIWVLAGTVVDALKALKLDIDVLVVQGTESGGHGTSFQYGLPLLTFLATLQPHITSKSPLLVAAGGIGNGAQLVSVLPFASGAVMGTAFLAAPECLYSAGQKNLILQSGGEDTVRTGRFDEARGTLGWGEQVDGRGLKNLTSEAEGGGGREVYDEAAKNGDVTRIVTWAGTSVGLTTRSEPAEKIVQEIERTANMTLDALLKLKD